MAIRPAGHDDLPAFFAYLAEQLGENGVGATARFMPLARSAAGALPADKEGQFRAGIATPLGKPGWRRLWLAWDAQGRLAGHIDLRARAEAHAGHRAMLGMGVQRAARRQGLGAALAAVALAWARSDTELAWIDLEVLSGNLPARALYARLGFVQTGEIADLYRIDGEALGEVTMSLALARG